MVSLSHRGSVEGLEVDRPPRFPTVLGDNNHSGAPCDWCVDRNRFNYSKSYISHQILVDFLLPMKRNGHRSVDSDGLDIRSGWDGKGFSTHQW